MKKTSKMRWIWFWFLSQLFSGVVFCFVGDFLKEPHVYEDLLDFKSLKGFMESQLEDYNLTPGVVPMNLVLFRDAIEHGKFKVPIHIKIHKSQITLAQISNKYPLACVCL